MLKELEASEILTTKVLHPKLLGLFVRVIPAAISWRLDAGDGSHPQHHTRTDPSQNGIISEAVFHIAQNLNLKPRKLTFKEISLTMEHVNMIKHQARNRCGKAIVALWLCSLAACSSPLIRGKSADWIPLTPQAVVETGLHTAAIVSVSVDAAEHFAVTGGEDKTIRVWNLANGALLRTIRIPIAPGDVGQINAVAISPDGSLIAASGWTSPNEEEKLLYIFDRKSGEQLAHINVGWQVVFSLAFSPSGAYLAIGQQDTLRIFSSGGFKEITRDQDYGGRILGLDFATDGRLVTASLDGFIHVYNPSFQKDYQDQSNGRKRTSKHCFLAQ